MKKIKLLYVEDYPVIQIMYRDVLKAHGFEVDVVNDGKLALAKVAENDYDIVLLDLLLPQVTGLEFLRELRKNGNQVTVIVLTDFDKPETIEQVRELGVEQYWIKVENPPHALAERLEEFLKNNNQAKI